MGTQQVVNKRLAKLQALIRAEKNTLARAEAQSEAAIESLIRSRGRIREATLRIRALEKRMAKAALESITPTPPVLTNKELAVGVAVREIVPIPEPEEPELSKFLVRLAKQPATEVEIMPEPQAKEGSGIPDYLDRSKCKPGKTFAETFREEIEAQRKQKARGRIARMKAKKSGETKRMPLSGNDALRHINSGRTKSGDMM